MAGKDFNELELLSQKELILRSIRHYLESAEELSRREDVTGAFFKSLNGFSLENRVWFILWEGGGAQRFTDILKAVDCSTATLSKALMNLLNAEPALVRMVKGRYQAVSPVWLLHFSEVNR